MKELFRADINEQTFKLRKQFYQLSYDLYDKDKKRGKSERLCLIWYSAVLVFSFLFDPVKLDEGNFARFAAVGFALVFIWCLLAFRRFRNRVWLNIVYSIEVLRARKMKLTGVSLLFGENGIAFRTGDSAEKEKTVWEYASVEYVVESRDAFFLFSKKDQGAFFWKRCMTLGDPDGFRSFITFKTGKEIRRGIR